MAMASIVMIPAALLGLAIWAGLLYLLVLLIRALRKYLRGGEARREKAETCRTLGEILTEKSGNLNLGVEGIMFMGGALGLGGVFYYEKAVSVPNGILAVLIGHLGRFDSNRIALRHGYTCLHFEPVDGRIQRLIPIATA